jgi:hypothetical protein
MFFNLISLFIFIEMSSLIKCLRLLWLSIIVCKFVFCLLH